MTTKPPSRSEEIRQRRKSQTQQAPKTARAVIPAVKKPALRPQTMYLPGEANRVAPLPKRPVAGGKPRTGMGMAVPLGTRARAERGNRSERRSYDVAFSLGRTDVRAPGLALPQLGPRWISAGLTLLLGFLIYTMCTASAFTVQAAEVSGNERLTTEDITSGLGVAGKPIFTAIPAKIADNLRLAYPDLAVVEVHVRFPNHVVVRVVERTPVLGWKQDGQLKWIDASGIAFSPRGEVQNLVTVNSSGSPSGQALDPTKTLANQVFIDPQMVKGILELAPFVPPGITITFDPQYGMGWDDPKGWSVYFGHNTNDIAMKLQVYQSMVTTLSQKGIQPTLISVEYLDAPFYK